MFRTRAVLAAFLLLPLPAQNQTPTATGGQLPRGSGRDVAAANCLSCHDAGRLATPGYNREGWQDVIERMRNIGVVLVPEQVPVHFVLSQLQVRVLSVQVWVMPQVVLPFSSLQLQTSIPAVVSQMPLPVLPHSFPPAVQRQ